MLALKSNTMKFNLAGQTMNLALLGLSSYVSGQRLRSQKMNQSPATDSPTQGTEIEAIEDQNSGVDLRELRKVVKGAIPYVWKGMTQMQLCLQYADSQAAMKSQIETNEEQKRVHRENQKRCRDPEKIPENLFVQLFEIGSSIIDQYANGMPQCGKCTNCKSDEDLYLQHKKRQQTSLQVIGGIYWQMGHLIDGEDASGPENAKVPASGKQQGKLLRGQDKKRND